MSGETFSECQIGKTALELELSLLLTRYSFKEGPQNKAIKQLACSEEGMEGGVAFRGCISQTFDIALVSSSLCCRGERCVRFVLKGGHN